MKRRTGFMSGIRLALPSELDALAEIDADATALYAEYGIVIDLSAEHPFVRAELARWARSLELGRVFLAVDDAGTTVGFAALDVLDGEPYLDQLSVRRTATRRGVGSRLLARSAEWARGLGARRLWLTTYAHLPFNRAFYERHGYIVAPEAECGPGVVHHLDEQRAHLPAPGERIAMRLLLGPR